MVTVTRGQGEPSGDYGRGLWGQAQDSTHLSWASHFCSLGLSFLPCKMGVITGQLHKIEVRKEQPVPGSCYYCN